MLAEVADSLIPNSLLSRGVDTARRARLVLYGITLANLASICAIGLMISMGYPETAASLLLTVLLQSSVYIVMVVSRSPVLAGHVFAAVVLFEIAWDHGPDRGHAVVAAIAVPVLAAALTGVRGGLLWTFATVGWTVVLGPFLVRAGDMDPVLSITSGLLALVVGLASVVVESTRARAEQESKIAEGRLRIQQNRIREFAEELFPGLAVTSGSIVQYVSPGVRTLIGFAPERMLGRDLVEFVHPDDRTEVLAPAVNEGQRRFHVELRLSCEPDGWRWCEVFGLANGDEDDPHRWIFGARDVAEEKHARERLHQAQRLESVGTLAAGVAHDFNNLLTVINGFADLLPEGREQDGILGAVSQASDLTGQLLSFGRPVAAESQTADIVAVLRHMQPMVRSLLGERIELQLSYPKEAMPVMLDQARIGQILLNLVSNARDAIDDAGQLTIDIEPVELDSTNAQRFGLPAGGYVLLAVRDNGVGMSEEERRRALDPFYSTKASGTGLGLASTYGIVTACGGAFELRSAPGVGTDVAIYLPVGSPPESAPVAMPGHAELNKESAQSVLLVEDEPMIRQLCCQILEQAGYSVVAVESGREAIDASSAWQPDLLVTDIVMPGLRGTELAERLRGRWPELPVLFISGYPDDELRDWQTGPAANARLLAKPFRSTALLAAVASLMPDARVPADPG